jgi:putative SOS response-associated peptidase YedK
MRNLYSVTKSQTAIRELARAMHNRTGNLPPLPGIFPDYGAPIVRESSQGRELVLARWGMPSPLFALKGKKTDPGVTNIRNVKSPHWRRWLAPESRCLVPFTSFSENELSPGGSRQPVWFALVGARSPGCSCSDRSGAARRARAHRARLPIGIPRLIHVHPHPIPREWKTLV